MCLWRAPRQTVRDLGKKIRKIRRAAWDRALPVFPAQDFYSISRCAFGLSQNVDGHLGFLYLYVQACIIIHIHVLCHACKGQGAWAGKTSQYAMFFNSPLMGGTVHKRARPFKQNMQTVQRKSKYTGPGKTQSRHGPRQHKSEQLAS